MQVVRMWLTVQALLAVTMVRYSWAKPTQTSSCNSKSRSAKKGQQCPFFLCVIAAGQFRRKLQQVNFKKNAYNSCANCLSDYNAVRNLNNGVTNDNFCKDICRWR